MAIKKVYVSDFTGKDITGGHKTISINKTETKKYSGYYGRGRTYRQSVAKVFHLADEEVNMLPEAIREHLWPSPKPKVEKEKKPAKSA